MTQTDNSAIVATPLNGHIGAEISLKKLHLSD